MASQIEFESVAQELLQTLQENPSMAFDAAALLDLSVCALSLADMVEDFMSGRQHDA